MDNEISVNDIIFNWLIFWALILIGSALLACAVLIPLVYENDKLIFEYNLVAKQLARLKEANKVLVWQTSAIGKDPGFTEDIARKELNLRKPGVETITVRPAPIKKPHKNNQISSNLFILHNADKWYIKPFLQLQTRLWIFAIAIGLILTGIITAK